MDPRGHEGVLTDRHDRDTPGLHERRTPGIVFRVLSAV